MKPQAKDNDDKHYSKTGLFFVVCFEILVLLIYGFFTSFSNTISPVSGLEYIFTNVLAVLGFGLLLVYYRLSIKQCLFIALVVCFVNVQMGPMLQQFWFNVFVKGFDPSSLAADANVPLLQDTAQQRISNMTLGFVRISTFCSISLLVALTGVIGKIGILNTFITTVIFNVGFNLSYYLNFLVLYKNGPSLYLINDDFQGSRVFMFGAGFGIALFLLYHRFHPIEKKNVDYVDHLSSIWTLIGTCFVLAFFYFVLDSYTNGFKSYALLNVYFAFSASIVSSIAVCCIINGFITFYDINMSVLSGALQISIIATFIKTPYVSLLVGAFAGIVTSLATHYVIPRINNKHIRDTKGVFVIYFINAFLCSYFVSPIIIQAYQNTNTAQDDYNEAFHMIFTSISLGVGFGFGLLAGIFRWCVTEDIHLSDDEFFNSKFQTQEVAPAPRVPAEQNTQEMLNFDNEQTKNKTNVEASTLQITF